VRAKRRLRRRFALTQPLQKQNKRPVIPSPACRNGSAGRAARNLNIIFQIGIIWQDIKKEFVIKNLKYFIL
jgi:hypothetical protein